MKIGWTAPALLLAASVHAQGQDALYVGSLAATCAACHAGNRWVGVDYRTFAATAAPDVHVVGDAIQVAPAMSKSGHMASVHEYVTAEKTFKAVPASGGVSAAPSQQEGVYAMGWARDIWTDTLG